MITWHRLKKSSDAGMRDFEAGLAGSYPFYGPIYTKETSMCHNLCGDPEPPKPTHFHTAVPKHASSVTLNISSNGRVEGCQWVIGPTWPATSYDQGYKQGQKDYAYQRDYVTAEECAKRVSAAEDRGYGAGMKSARFVSPYGIAKIFTYDLSTQQWRYLAEAPIIGTATREGLMRVAQDLAKGSPLKLPVPIGRYQIIAGKIAVVVEVKDAQRTVVEVAA